MISLLKGCAVAGTLLGLPLLGSALAGLPLGRYLEFPPATRHLQHAPFSWSAFAAGALILLLTLLGIAYLAFGKPRACTPEPSEGRPFPWWGWLGVASCLFLWVLSWTRFSWLGSFQGHTFTPLWVSYILVMNGLCHCRGRAPMTERPLAFLSLFPVSALFWWFFEYLNRFVENWQYTGVQLEPWSYFWNATLSFSTVLPAFASTQRWIRGLPRVSCGFTGVVPPKSLLSRAAPWGGLALSCAGLTGIGVWPDYLFPLLWVSPLVIMASLQSLTGGWHVFQEVPEGDWRGVVSSALAGLMCGFFWELWNLHSLAKWQYAVPYVNRFRIFEMPLLGYGGYLPFGLECATVLGMLGMTSGLDRSARV